MKYTKLGSTNIEVSKLCVGCMSFGVPSEDFHQWTLSYEESAAVVKKALDLGINFFDTANIYSHGTSEEFLGRAIREYTSREKTVIATKVYFNEGKLSKQGILNSVDQSLKRLGTDYIDLYIIHRFDYDTPVEETMETLDSLVKAGKVRALGASAMYGYQFHNMQLCAEQNDWTKFQTMQNHYNLLYREDEREMIPICRQYGVSLTPYSPLAAGRLSRKEWKTDSKRSQTDRVAVSKYDSTQQQDMQIAARVAELAEKYDVSMSQIAIAWLWAKGAASPLIGATKPRYFDDIANAFSITLTQEDISYLEECYIPHKIVGAL